jgi:hypothetical protein
VSLPPKLLHNLLCTLGHPEIFEIPLSKISAAPKTAQQRKPQGRRAPAKMAIERDRWASMLQPSGRELRKPWCVGQAGADTELDAVVTVLF